MTYYRVPEDHNRFLIECWLEGEEGCTGYRVTGVRTWRKARRLHWRHYVRQHPQRARAAWEQRMAEGQSS